MEVGRTEQKKREVRQRIVEAATGLFIERGSRAVLMDDIAVVADVARRTLFNHFATKDDLVRAVSEPVLQEAVRLADEAAALPGDPTDRVIALCLALWKSCGRRLGLIYATDFADSPELGALHKRFLASFRKLAAPTGSDRPTTGGLSSKIVYRCFVPLLLALDGAADLEPRFERGMRGLLEGASS